VEPARPASEAMLMTLPWPRATIDGSAALQT
jgi:hypothetical protein